MKTFIPLKDVHRVTHIDGDELTGITVDYTDQCVVLQQSEYEITITISYIWKEESHQIGCSSREKIPEYTIKRYKLIYEQIKLAIFDDDKFVEIEVE